MEDSRTPIRVLHLEDDAFAARLIAQSLKGAGFRCEIVVASEKYRFESAARTGAFDLILCDYNLPDYDGLSALKFARIHQPGTPVIMISGTLNEDDAVECLKAGASDYVLKQGLQRLARAAQKALDEAANEKQLRLAEIQRRKSEQKFEDLFEFAPYGIIIWDDAGIIRLVNQRAERMFGYKREELIGSPISILAAASPSVFDAVPNQLAMMNEPARIDDGELDGLRKDGTVFPAEVSLSRIRTETGPMVAATVRDLTPPAHYRDT
jgi:PAS domain S-box-containing protein